MISNEEGNGKHKVERKRKLSEGGNFSTNDDTDHRSATQRESSEALAPASDDESSTNSFVPSNNIYQGVAFDEQRVVYKRRPRNWKLITEHYREHGLESTVKVFAKNLTPCTLETASEKLRKWEKEFIKKDEPKHHGRVPVYGAKIDNELLEVVKNQIIGGQNMDDTILRESLIKILSVHGKMNLAAEYGGNYVFEHSWAARFWKRHEKILKEMEEISEGKTGRTHSFPGQGNSEALNETHRRSSYNSDVDDGSSILIAGHEHLLLDVKTTKTESSVNNSNSGVTSSLVTTADADAAALAGGIKKPWTRRPKNWRAIAQTFLELGMYATLKEFPEELQGFSHTSLYQKLHIWKKDLDADRAFKPAGPVPKYGEDVDHQLIALVRARMESGITVDLSLLRELLVELLNAHKKQDLLCENGGSFSFGYAWAARFWARHKLPGKVITGMKSKCFSTARLCSGNVGNNNNNINNMGLMVNNNNMSVGVDNATGNSRMHSNGNCNMNDDEVQRHHQTQLQYPLLPEGVGSSVGSGLMIYHEEEDDDEEEAHDSMRLVDDDDEEEDSSCSSSEEEELEEIGNNIDNNDTGEQHLLQQQHQQQHQILSDNVHPLDDSMNFHHHHHHTIIMANDDNTTRLTMANNNN